MNDVVNYVILVEVVLCFFDDQFMLEDGCYVFVYMICIYNEGWIVVWLVVWYWCIIDVNGCIEYVDGDGVIGEQLCLWLGEDFCYIFGVMLEMEYGMMQGYYDMVVDDGIEFVVLIVLFVLIVLCILY